MHVPIWFVKVCWQTWILSVLTFSDEVRLVFAGWCTDTLLRLADGFSGRIYLGQHSPSSGQPRILIWRQNQPWSRISTLFVFVCISPLSGVVLWLIVQGSRSVISECAMSCMSMMPATTHVLWSLFAYQDFYPLCVLCLKFWICWTDTTRSKWRVRS